jgi:hypothetical protein
MTEKCDFACVPCTLMAGLYACSQPGHSCPQPGCLCHQFMGVGRKAHAVSQTPRAAKARLLSLSLFLGSANYFLLLLYERLKAERNFMGLFIRSAPCVVQIFLIATDTAAEFAYCKLFLGC